MFACYSMVTGSDQSWRFIDSLSETQRFWDGNKVSLREAVFLCEKKNTDISGEFSFLNCISNFKAMYSEANDKVWGNHINS